MARYPIYISLINQSVSVVGVGPVGQRKIQRLLKSQPKEIKVIDPSLTDAKIYEIVNNLFIKYKETKFTPLKRKFSPELIEGDFLVFAATNNEDANESIVLACKERKILCNKADSKGTPGDFIVPASIEKGAISLSISTGGNSPALSRRLRIDLEEWMGNRYTALADILGKVRPELLKLGLTTKENTFIFRKIVNSSLAELIEKNQKSEAEELLKSILPEELESLAIKVLNDI